MPDENRPEEFGFDALSRRLQAAMDPESNDSLANSTLNELSKGFMDTVRLCRTAVLEFYTVNCPYCRQLTPLFEE